MRSFARLDYLCLEIDRARFLKILMADKSTQSDECQHIEIATEHYNSLSSQLNTVKQPPKRPPPPKLKSVDDSVLLKSQRKTSGVDWTRISRDLKIKRKFNTIKEKTSTFTKTVYRKIGKKPKSKSVNEYTQVNGDIMSETKQNVSIDETNCEKIIPTTAEMNYQPKPIDQVDSIKTIKQKSTPPKITKSVSSVLSIEDILNENESVLSRFDILLMINDFLANDLSETEIPYFDQYVDNCLTAFTRSCHLQVKDTIIDLNDKLAYFLDLDSISLTSNQPDIYIVHCIPGWKQIRIIENSNTKEKYLSLKNSHYQAWIQVNLEKSNLNQRWVCFPIHSINTLEIEIQLAEQNDFRRNLLKLIMLICVNHIYNDEKFPKNIDPNTILLVSSKCGIIVIFKECLNECELFSLDFLGCDSIENVADNLLESKINIIRIIKNFFQRPEVISILISSTWPLDYLALFLAELVIDREE